jgi:hypothetical protein
MGPSKMSVRLKMAKIIRCIGFQEKISEHCTTTCLASFGKALPEAAKYQLQPKTTYATGKGSQINGGVEK